VIDRRGSDVDDDSNVIQQHQDCHQSRRYIYAIEQYVSLTEQQGILYEPPLALQISIEEVEIWPLSVCAELTEVF